jgi:hypothetical protein
MLVSKKNIMRDVFNKQINNYYKNFYLKLLLFWVNFILLKKKKKKEIPLYMSTNKFFFATKNSYGLALVPYSFILDSLFKNKLFLIKF